MLGQLLLLVQVLLDLAVDAAQLCTQFVELLLQRIDFLLGVALFVLVMPTQALQQGFGLMVGMFLAATHRAGLVVLQLCAQRFDALAAGQALALQQLPGDVQRLLGSGQPGLAVEAFADQLLALLEGALLALAQGRETLVQLVLLAPEPAECFHLALLLAVFLQQLAQQTDLLGQGVGLGLGFVVEQGDGGTLLLQRLTRLGRPLLQAGQLRAALVEAVAQLHQLLQAIAVGVPGFAEAGEGSTLRQLLADLAEALLGQSLLFEQVGQLLLTLAAGKFRLQLEGLATGQFLGQARQGVLLGKGLAQQGCAIALLRQRLRQRLLGIELLLLQLLLVREQGIVLLALGTDAGGQG
ncbi:hypothetical protein D3C77_359940 [compost metagenome]